MTGGLRIWMGRRFVVVGALLLLIFCAVHLGPRVVALSDCHIHVGVAVMDQMQTPQQRHFMINAVLPVTPEVEQDGCD